MTELGARAVVSDDGSTISLTIYTEAGRAAAAVIEPVRAIALAGELIEAALLRLSVAKPHQNNGLKDGFGRPHREKT